MVNFTITIPEDLKAEMDKLTDVNWSDVCRQAIRMYLTTRFQSNPPVLVSIESVSLETGYPDRLQVMIALTNEIDSKIQLERIEFRIKLFGGQQWDLGAGICYTAKEIPPKRRVTVPLRSEVRLEWLAVFNQATNQMFQCSVDIDVYAHGFSQPTRFSGLPVIPIDVWRRSADMIFSGAAKRQAILSQTLEKHLPPKR